MLDTIKRALDITGSDFDEELNDLMEQAKADLKFASVKESKIVDSDPTIKRAVVTYCKMNFGNVDPSDYAKYERAYNELKAQLSMSGYSYEE